MDVPAVEVLVDPASTVTVLAFVVAGVALGTASGLTPGLHANNVAMLLAALAPALPGAPRLVAAAILAAGVVHTFLDIVPALALGVPDAAMAASALPGHRLVLAGRGREALRLSALGSVLAVVIALPLALPVTMAVQAAYPTLSAHLHFLLGAIAVGLVISEPDPTRAAGAILAILGSGLLGVLALDLPTAGLVSAGGILTPLFAGLFGAPVLLDAMRGSGPPPQTGPAVTTPKPVVGSCALVGTMAGAVVGYVPGVSSAIATTGALVALPARGPRAFVVATSGANTANMVFALFALLSLGSPRTGVLVAMDDAGLPLDLPLLTATVVLAAVAGFSLVLVAGDRYLAAIGRVDNVRLSAVVLVGLAGLSVAFAGTIGLPVFLASTVVGIVPARAGCKRATLMGVLLVPLALGV